MGINEVRGQGLGPSGRQVSSVLGRIDPEHGECKMQLKLKQMHEVGGERHALVEWVVFKCRNEDHRYARKPNILTRFGSEPSAEDTHVSVIHRLLAVM